MSKRTITNDDLQEVAGASVPSVDDTYYLGSSSKRWKGLYFSSGILNKSSTVAYTFPAASDTMVGLATTDVLTNKTINAPTLGGPVAATGVCNFNTTGSGSNNLGNASSSNFFIAGVNEFRSTVTPGTTNSFDLGSTSFRWKDLYLQGTVKNSGGTLSLPSATDTLVGKATTDVLTNKDVSSGTNTFPATLATQDTATSNNLSTNFTGPFAAQNGKTITYKKAGGVVFFTLPAISANATGSVIITQSAAWPSGYRPAADVKFPMIVNDSDGFGDGVFGFYRVTSAGVATITCGNDSAFTGSTGLGFPAQPLCFNTF